ncbi:acyltransferase, partial [Salmonella enterica subsp. enterica serovar Newport]
SNGSIIETITYLSFGIVFPLVLVSLVRKIRSKIFVNKYSPA